MENLAVSSQRTSGTRTPLNGAFLFIFHLFLFSATVSADPGDSLGIFDSEDARINVVVVADRLRVPWGLAFLPDNRLLVTERRGHMDTVDPHTGEITRLQGLPPIATGGQGGLLDVILHPRYQQNGWIYFSYTAKRRGDRSTHVARARLQGNSLTDLEVLFVAEPFFGATYHFGSRLAIDASDHLFITVGDRRHRHEAQALDAHMGKIIRLRDDGSVPEDNPFVNEPGARPEIFSLGHRNPQGLTIHPVTYELWVHEHGPRGGDEVNIIRAGNNYGWPVITYGKEYSGGRIGEGTHKVGMEQPIKYYVPSIAPSGMLFYTGSRFPAWRGNLFIGAMTLEHLNRLVLEENEVIAEERLLTELGYRVRNVRQGPDELLYLLVDKGMILRLEPVE